ncbi:leucine--tRNA ligase [Pyrolobus fumarii]|uniref:leucine--tRNA ligase n=1 Tax=Pyrolobus fumarii TaxID=54252 RepID=UPI00064EDE80
MNEFAELLVKIADKWRARWEEAKVFEADPNPEKPKFFVTAAFPYPNSPQHIGHGRTYTIADVYARYKRLRGFNVLFPMGFHYTGTPIITMAEAIAEGDKELIDIMVNVYGVPKEDLEKLKDPLQLARYFHEDIKAGMKEMGYSIDWRREFTTVDPEFKKFVVWQFERLRSKGLLTRGTHPVGWCPKHEMPVGMHDTKNDVEPEIGEFTLIKFIDDEGRVYPAATLRPETVFGVTNVWVNPRAEYVEVDVDGERWVVSKRAAFKLRYQRRRVEVIRELKGEELLGKRLLNPATGRKVPILPATFVDPDTATGIVMSVPAHAPFDYAALRDLLESEQGRELLEKLGVDSSELEPIPVISVRGYKEVPAKQIVEDMGITSQEQRKLLEEATKKLYSDEYHHGVMRSDIIGLALRHLPEEYRRYAIAAVKAWIAEKPVPEAREATKKWLEAIGYADIMYEVMNKPVYCRCGTEIVVKVLEDQWFINYGDPEWKKLAREALARMRIVPPEMREEFEKTIDWLHERACARTRGLGTELPWAKGWIIESLSDSTIYMAFYTVIHKIRKYGLQPEQLTVNFWDYVLLGSGDPKKVSKETGIPVEVLKELREEFEYWYPLDSRHSARDLVPNHLTFFIFNHAAIFPREKWPRQIVVNGLVLLAGKKMSKSLRNIIPLRKAIRVYSPDVMRASLIVGAELLQDVNFTHGLAMSVLGRLQRIYDIAKSVVSLERRRPEQLTLADRWLLSRLQYHKERVTNAYENLRLREAGIILLYEMVEDVNRYLEVRGTTPEAAWVLRKYLTEWIVMLSPITPFIAEELWQMLGGEGFVSTAKWPKIEEELRDPQAELAFQYVRRLVDDARDILRVLKSKPRVMKIVIVPREEWSLLKKAVTAASERKPQREFIQEVLAEVDDPKLRKEVAMKARKLYEFAMSLDDYTRRLIAEAEALDEKHVIEELVGVIQKAVGVEKIEVMETVEAEGKVPPAKIKAALPMRPAIVFE